MTYLKQTHWNLSEMDLFLISKRHDFFHMCFKKIIINIDIGQLYSMRIFTKTVIIKLDHN